jgi:hypothetical protein
MNGNQIRTWALLLLVGLAWYEFAQKPTRGRLETAILRSLGF